MLAKLKNSKNPSSTSKVSGALAGSSGAFEQGLTGANEMTSELNTGSTAPEIQAAQKLLARIAVRLLNTKRRKEEEK
jgi:hypothetical protein